MLKPHENTIPPARFDRSEKGMPIRAIIMQIKG